MKRVLFAVMVVLLAKGALMAQVGSEDVATQRDVQKYTEIMTPVLDIDARDRAQFYKENADAYERFQHGKLFGRQVVPPQYEKELRALVEKYMNSSDPIVITEEEKEKLESHRRQFDRFRHATWTDQIQTSKELALMNRKIREIEDPVFELEARYWAYRVANVKDITFDELKEYSYGWVGEYQYNDKLMDKVKENLDTGNTAKLSRSEEKKLEKAKKRVIKLLTPKK